MAIRSGMLNLVQRVRDLSDAPTVYTDSSTPFWADDDIQNILDSNTTFFIDDPLTWRPQTIGGGTVQYHALNSHWRDLEEAESGTARWIVRDGNGADAGTANYTTNYRQGLVTFAADQAGTAYYLTGYSYDVHAAAADVWLERLANFADWYDFSADNQTFNRDQAFEHATKMETRSRQLSGKNVVLQSQGDLRIGEFVRTDINASN